jgi:hypothetical protein
MKKIIVFFLLGSIYVRVESNAITYHSYEESRTGDHLIGYSHAKWVSYKYKVPLFYKPFAYSDELLLSSAYKLSTKDTKRFSKIIVLKRPQNIAQIKKDKNILYVLPPFFPEVEDAGQWSKFDINWDDPQFLSELKKEIKPRRALKLVHIPSGYISIAVHIRTGRGYDFPLSNTQGPAPSNTVNGWNPLRWPPLAYYIRQIKDIYTMLHKKPLYVYLFTDDPNPAMLAKKIKQSLNNSAIKLNFRGKRNHHSRNVLEDLFSITKFDYLIRGESNFSFIAEKLGNFKMIVKPSKYHWHRGILVIDKVLFKFPGQNKWNKPKGRGVK